MLQAAHDICRFYQEVAPKLAKSHNLTYQNDFEQMMMGQLHELDNVV